MEKVKGFFKNSKYTATLGLLSSILVLYYSCQDFHILNQSIWISLGMVIYFSIIVNRYYRQKGNIKKANIFLIVFCIIGSAIDIIKIFMFIPYIKDYGVSAYHTSIIINLMLNILNTLYLFNILLRQNKYINNKVFVIANIAMSIYFIISMNFNSFTITFYIFYMLRIPYFYNYYNLIKGGQ